MDSDRNKDMSSHPLSPRSESNYHHQPTDPNIPSSSTTVTSNDKSHAASTSHSDIQELEIRYPAFVRRDSYGTMGRGPLPWTQKILLFIALITLFPLRLLFSALVVLLYYLICKACTLFLAPNQQHEQEDYAHIGGWRRNVIFWFGRVLARLLLFVFGFYWITETYRNPDIDSKFNNEVDASGKSEEVERPGAIISNHVSHLDILYHMSSSFPSFVAKRSVGKLPLIGLISKCLGCIYVQRESKSADFKGVSGVVNDRINNSRQDKSAPMVMLFPEGTTTNGDYILPFKTGAFLSKAPVLPVILRYPYQRFSPAWDTISGRRHVILLLCQFVNYITVVRLPLYYPSQEEKEDPKLYAENVRRLMAREGDLKMSDIGLPEKRIYHAAVHGLFTER
ncbi:lysophospholipid acyltransferase LPEAT1-like [Bidens hawaiensis]|uniref:lysophospholipid acyltransferase LPEAT1-like n=1 Tax=Bidens hawaiensis TaxID=980011 RepID=UPI00404AE151